jgi:hypothetical protein
MACPQVMVREDGCQIWRVALNEKWAPNKGWLVLQLVDWARDVVTPVCNTNML